MLPTTKTIKGWTGTKSSPFNGTLLSVNISCKKGLTTKQTEYVYSKCKNEEVISSEQVYECENDDKPLLTQIEKVSGNSLYQYNHYYLQT